MTPAKESKANDASLTPAEAPALPPTLGSTLFGWIGSLISLIATRTGLDRREVKGVIVLAVVAIVAVAVVVPLSVFAGTSAPTATPSAHPSRPTSTAAPAPAHHNAAEGTCADVLDTADLADALGGSTDVSAAAGGLVFTIVGGFDCHYTFGETPSFANDLEAARDSGYVDVTVVPAAIVSSDVLAASLAPMHCSSSSRMASWSEGCTSMVAVGDWWFSLSARSFASHEDLQASFIAISAQLKTALLATAAAPAAKVVQPFDCASASTGRTLVRTWREAQEGTSELSAAASLLAAPVTCDFSEPDGGEHWYVTVYPGGAAAYETCTSDGRHGRRLSVAGVTSVFALAHDSGEYSATACATDGTSTIEVELSPGIAQTLSADPWNDQRVEVLGSLLTPIFAAIVPSTSPFIVPSTVAAATATVSALAGGDCSAVLDPAGLARLAGGSPDVYVGSESPQLELVGGIGCTYGFGTQSEGSTGTVRVSVAPSAIADPAVLEASLAPVDCRPAAFEYLGCDVTGTVAGWWYSLSVDTDQSVDELRASFSTISGLLENTLKAATAPARVNAVQPFDCGAADLGDLPWTRSRELPTGSIIEAAAFLLVAPSICEYTMPDEQTWSLTVYPGRGSMYDWCSHSGRPDQPLGSPLVVQGVESALALHSGEAPVACATDGTSAVRIVRLNYYYTTEGATWDETQRATLSSLLVPVFAAAG